MATPQIWRYGRGVQSGRDMTGYDVEARDGSIGSIDQSTEDVDEAWVIVDTGPWIFGKRVLIPAGLIDRIDDIEKRVYVDRTRDEIKNAPEYDITVGATVPYRQELGSYYATPPAVRMQEIRVPPPSGRRTEGARRTSTRSTSRSRSRSSGSSSKSRARSRGSSSQSRSGSSSRSRRGTSRSRRSDEPTRDELYEQAKRLDVPGRSKMNKTQLKQAISRRRGRSSATGRTTARSSSGSSRGRSSSGRSRSGGRRQAGSRGKANPVEVQTFLEGVSYPTERGDLIREAERRGASGQVRKTLERLPAERYESPTDVSKAIGDLRR